MREKMNKALHIAIIILFVIGLVWLMLSDFPEYTPEEIQQREKMQENFKDYIGFKMLFG